MTNATTISPLRQRMIEDMTARGLTPLTQKVQASPTPPTTCGCHLTAASEKPAPRRKYQAKRVKDAGTSAP